METLVRQDLLVRLKQVEGVAAVVVAGPDGLVIEGTGAAEEALTGLAALGVQAARLAGRLQAVGLLDGTPSIKVESAGRLILLRPLPCQCVLVTVLADPANAGYVAFLVDGDLDR